jgi:hypothetical protein
MEPVAILVGEFNPNGIGGTTLAMSLFGLENRWGKLPHTIYPYSTMERLTCGIISCLLHRDVPTDTSLESPSFPLGLAYHSLLLNRRAI